MASPHVEARDVVMTLADGTKLATDVIVKNDGEQHPVLLVRTPYARASLRATHDPIELARSGWAVVLQDVRGRLGSSGQFGALFQEGPDGAAAVEWCASQPWSNGRVTMLGASYNGFTQWAAAREQPKGLAAISPMITTPYAENSWFREGGAFRLGGWSLWAMGMATFGNGGKRAAERRAQKDTLRWREILAYPPDVERISSHFPAFADWFAGDSEYWAPIDGARKVSSLQVAAYHLTGWYDIFVEGALEAYRELAHGSRRAEVRRAQRLVVGPWGHAAVLLQQVGQLDFGIEANAAYHRIYGEQLQFLRDAGEGREVKGGADIFVMGSNRWLELDAWPPPTSDTSFYLESGSAANSVRGDGRLLTEPAERTRSDRYRHDPTEPVPTLGGRHMIWDINPPGPAEQTPVEERRDVLVYTSEPLTRDLTVLGHVHADLHVSSSAHRADVHVKLVDVHPDGRAYNVVESVRRVDLTPGKAKRVDVDAGSTAMTFLRGHRIRIEVASSNFPSYDCLEAADQTVHWGGRSSSRLVLPTYELRGSSGG